MSQRYDPHNVDTEFALTNGRLQISTWPVKGIEQAESMMREAKVRKTAWEKRTKKDIVPGVMIFINTMLYGKLGPSIKKDVTSMSGDKARENFDLMKSTIESLKQMDAKSKTAPMDLSMLHDHGIYVKWSEDGAPEVWQEEWPEGAGDGVLGRQRVISHCSHCRGRANLRCP